MSIDRYRARLGSGFLSLALLAAPAGLSSPSGLSAQDPSTPPAGERRPVTDADLQSLHRLSGLALSPDGERIAFAQDGGVWVLDTAPGSSPRSPRRVAEGTNPTWSRDGDRLAFYARAEDTGELQVFTASIDGGVARQETRVDGGVVPDRIAWSSDDVLAFVVAAPRAPAADEEGAAPEPASAERGFPLILAPDSPDGYAFEGLLEGVAAPPRPSPATRELFVHDLRTGETRQLTRDGVEYLGPAWSPDGRTLACAAMDGFHRGQVVSTIFLIDAATGERRQISGNGVMSTNPSWSPDGESVAWVRYSRTGPTRNSISTFQPGGDGDGARRIYSFSATIGDFAWTADGRTLLITQVDGVTRPVGRVDPATADVETVGSAGYVTVGGTLTVSASGAVAWGESRGDTPVVIRLLRPGDDEAEEIYDPNPQLAEVELGRQEIVRWRNAAGDDREGVLILPVGYEPGTRYPLIVSAYSEGSHLNAFYSDGSPAFGNQRHAARGYAVFFPGPRVPWMYGGAFVSGHVGGSAGWGQMIDDVESGVDVLIERGLVDPDRMAIMGFSNGGAAAAAMITRSHRYRAAVAVAPANLNWVESALRQDNTAERWIPTATFVGIREDVLENPAEYVRGSPVFEMGNVETPLLLAVGDRDDASFTIPTVEIYLALRRLRKEVTLLRYAGMAHGFFGPAADDLNERIAEFLERHLDPDG
ncbi:MAG: prolyl oligopeptidase family serine peptidase [Gemmatimonadota bacterium]|nr:prolyl oligopeptidase family serine peptidase [Gemmatimonadota bacterium]